MWTRTAGSPTSPTSRRPPMPSPRSVVAGVEALAEAAGATDPVGPLRQGRFQSPLRDERLAAWLGASLRVLFGIPSLPGVSPPPHRQPVSWLPMPARPAGLFRI